MTIDDLDEFERVAQDANRPSTVGITERHGVLYDAPEIRAYDKKFKPAVVLELIALARKGQTLEAAEQALQEIDKIVWDLTSKVANIVREVREAVEKAK